jgi:hypothetical protein
MTIALAPPCGLSQKASVLWTIESLNAPQNATQRLYAPSLSVTTSLSDETRSKYPSRGSSPRDRERSGLVGTINERDRHIGVS